MGVRGSGRDRRRRCVSSAVSGPRPPELLVQQLTQRNLMPAGSSNVLVDAASFRSSGGFDVGAPAPRGLGHVVAARTVRPSRLRARSARRLSASIRLRRRSTPAG